MAAKHAKVLAQGAQASYVQVRSDLRRNHSTIHIQLFSPFKRYFSQIENQRLFWTQLKLRLQMFNTEFAAAKKFSSTPT